MIDRFDLHTQVAGLFLCSPRALNYGVGVGMPDPVRWAEGRDALKLDAVIKPFDSADGIVRDIVDRLRSVSDVMPLRYDIEKLVRDYLSDPEEYCGDITALASHMQALRQAGRLETLGLRHIFALARDLYRIENDGTLVCRVEPERRFHRLGAFPATLLQAARCAEQNPESPRKHRPVERLVENDEHFERELDKGISDGHLHFGQALSFDILFVTAMLNAYNPGQPLDYPSSGNADWVLRDDGYSYSLLTLLRIAQVILPRLRTAAESNVCYFPDFLDIRQPSGTMGDFSNKSTNDLDNHVTRKEPGREWLERFWPLAWNVFATGKRTNGIEGTVFFDAIRELCAPPESGLPQNDMEIPEEFFRYFHSIFCHVLRHPEDTDFHMAATQAVRCACIPYRDFRHRETFHEFQGKVDLTRTFIQIAGLEDDSRRWRQPIKRRDERTDHLFREECTDLRVPWLLFEPGGKKRIKRLHLRFSILSHRSTFEMARAMCRLLRGYRLALTAKYDGFNWSNDTNAGISRRAMLPQDNMYTCTLPQVMFPVAFRRTPILPSHNDEKEWDLPANELVGEQSCSIRQQWNAMDRLSELFLRVPSSRRFFGLVDVFGHEDSQPNFTVAAVLWELQNRLRHPPDAIVQWPESMGLVRFCSHQGEHFHTPLHGLRRIWEGVNRLPSPVFIGHALALYDKNRWETEMRRDELFDDLLWASQMLLEIGHGVEISRKLTDEALRLARILFPEHKIDHSLLWQGYIGCYELDNMLQVGLLRPHHTHHRWHEYTGRVHKENELDLDQLRKKPELRLIRQRWSQKFYNGKNSEAREMVSLQSIREPMGKAYEILRDWLKNDLRSKGIILELCPISNRVIAGFRQFEDHPIFEFEPLADTQESWVTINTDDPSIFQNTVAEDLSTLYRVARRKSEKGAIERLQWIGKIRQKGLDVYQVAKDDHTLVTWLDDCLRDLKKYYTDGVPDAP